MRGFAEILADVKCSVRCRIAILWLLAALSSQLALAQTVTTLVSSGLSTPHGVAVDGQGNVYIADTRNNAIKKWNVSNQQVTTLVSSGLSAPYEAAVDGQGNVYIADSGNNAIKKWNVSNQQVTTLVSSVLAPSVVAVDGQANVYISDSTPSAIRKWNVSNQQVTTLSTGVSTPTGLAVDAQGNVYIADTFVHAIKKWSVSNQQVATLWFDVYSSPGGVAVDGQGNVYFSDGGTNTLRMWSAWNQQVTTLVSSGLNSPGGVAVDGQGNVYIADSGNNAIKKLSVAGVGCPAYQPPAFYGLTAPPAFMNSGSFPVDVALYHPGAPTQVFSTTTVPPGTNLFLITGAVGNDWGISVGTSCIFPVGAVAAYYPGVDWQATSSASGGFAVDSSKTLTISTSATPGGTTITLNGTDTARPTIPFTFNWGDGTFSTGFFPQTKTYSLSGAFTILVTAQYGGGMGSATTSLTINPTPCTYSVTPGFLRFPASGGSLNLNVQTTASCTWTLGWTINSGTPLSWLSAQYSFNTTTNIATGPQTVVLSATSNGTASTRSATVSVAGATVNVTQDAGITCSYTLSPDAAQVQATASNLNLSVTTAASCPWTLSGVPNWITASATSGAGPMTVALSIAANTSSSSRAATISIGGSGILVASATNITQAAGVAGGGGPVINSVVTVYAGTDISQNTWVAVKGTNLVPTSTPAAGQDWSKAPEFASGRMPTQLGGVSATINGKPAYMYFFCSAVTNKDCAQDQINLLTPLDNMLGAVSVVVTNNGASSAPFASTLRSSSPSFFQWAGRYAVATHVDGSLLGPTTLYPGASTPARPNEVITLWMTGFGLPATSLVQGSASQSGSLPANPVVQFNGAPAAISYAAVVSPGLYQINLTVPSNAPSGDNAVSASYGGANAPTGSFINVLSSSGAAPVISNFTASPPTIQAGQSSTLSWSVTNATSISIDNGIGTVTGSSRVVSPGSTTTYVLTASSSAGSVTASTTTTVAAPTPAPTISSFSASPSTITAGQSSTLSWSVSNATSISIDNGIGTVTGSSRTVNPATTTTYVLTASNAGGTRTASATVNVASACTVSGGVANDTMFVSNNGTLSNAGSSWYQSFSLGAATTFDFRVASDYKVQASIFAPDQLNAFINNQAFGGYASFNYTYGTKTSLTLAAGTYYVGIRNGVSAANSYDLELDYAMSIPGASYVDTYLNQAVSVDPNGGVLWQPFTVQCGFRYLMDGGNSGLETYIIPGNQLTAFQNNQTFYYYTDYSSPGVDNAQPGFYEVKLPPGDYYLVFHNSSAITKTAVYTMERFR